MVTITEDYVSFEVAKLLKEKGFEEKCLMRYNKVGDLVEEAYKFNWNFQTIDYSAPTLQIAMKWFRLKHNLSIEVYRTACGYIGCIVAIPSGTDIKFLEEDGDDLPSGTYTKWEYACEAAIKYCLENLI
jgi:hypothetical protein